MDGPSTRLETQLELALKDKFNHEGSFAFGETISSAPNPGLEIDTLGAVGLPLSARDVEFIKKVASRSPFGHGSKTIVNSTVRDTWEIDATRISFKNPAWSSFMEIVVEKSWKGLGVAPYTARPRCDLYKLLLYETGSHFLPHQDTEKAPGMFATVVIVLPSIYTGGEVRVVHGGEEKTFDFAGASQYNTSVLAWYADVVHEIKPIVSGFRLALTYNLIQSDQVAVPLLPMDLSATAYLKQVFAKWAEGAFKSPPHMICYKLAHEYSQANLERGVACLKGADALKVSQIKEASEGLGVSLALARFELHIVSDDTNEDDECSHYKRRRHNDEEEDNDEDDGHSSTGNSSRRIRSERRRTRAYVLNFNNKIGDGDESHDEDEDQDEDEDRDQDEDGNMDEVGDQVQDDYKFRSEHSQYCDGIIEIERESSINGLVNLDGDRMLPAERQICVDGKEVVLVPKDAFKKITPDEEEHSGYTGNEGASIDRWYRRAVLVFFLKKREDAILLEAGGATYAFAQLQKTALTDPSEKALKYIRYLLQSTLYDKEKELFLVELALKWGDSELWLKAADKIGFAYDPTVVGWDRVVAAWDKFGFDVLRPSFELALRNMLSFNQKMRIIDLVRAQSERHPKDSVKEWCEQQTISSLSSVPRPRVDDVPTYLSVLKSNGAKFFIERIMPQLVKYSETYAFFIQFAEQLQSQRSEAEQFHSESTQALLYDSQQAALNQWKLTKYDQQGGKYDCVGLIGCLIRADNLPLLKSLFEALMEDVEGLRAKFRDFFIPLFPDLMRVLEGHGISVDSEVCKDFFRWLIENYLECMLGGPDSVICHPSVRKIGCANSGCKECFALDSFLLSAEPTHMFRYAERARNHLKWQIEHAHTLVSCKIIKEGRPYGLEVKKRKEIVNGGSWGGRQAAAKKFIASIGGDKAVERIMGEKAKKVQKALSGEKAYESAAPQASSQTSSTTKTNGHGHTSKVKGVKRKERA